MNYNNKISTILVASWRIILVVVFGFLPQNCGRWWGPMNGTVSFYSVGWVVGTHRGGGDTQTLPAVIKLVWTFALRNSGDAKASSSCPLAPCTCWRPFAPDAKATLRNFHYLIFIQYKLQNVKSFKFVFRSLLLFCLCDSGQVSRWSNGMMLGQIAKVHCSIPCWDTGFFSDGY